MRNHSVLATLIPVLLACIAAGQTRPTWQPPFSATHRDFQAAFAGIEAGDNPVTVLLEEGRYEFDSSGRYTYSLRTIFKVWSKAGAEDWAMIQHTGLRGKATDLLCEPG